MGFRRQVADDVGGALRAQSQAVALFGQPRQSPSTAKYQRPLCTCAPSQPMTSLACQKVTGKPFVRK
jgi:hypothetical protein